MKWWNFRDEKKILKNLKNLKNLKILKNLKLFLKLYNPKLFLKNVKVLKNSTRYKKFGSIDFQIIFKKFYIF